MNANRILYRSRYIGIHETNDVIIKCIFDVKEMNTDIPKKEIRQLLNLFTKNAQLTLHNKTCKFECVAMGSPLDPVLQTSLWWSSDEM